MSHEPLGLSVAGAHYGIKKDSFGIPWDERIHVLSKTKTPDGQWKVKKNMDREMIDKIKTSLFEYWNN